MLACGCVCMYIHVKIDAIYTVWIFTWLYADHKGIYQISSCVLYPIWPDLPNTLITWLWQIQSFTLQVKFTDHLQLQFSFKIKPCYLSNIKPFWSFIIKFLAVIALASRCWRTTKRTFPISKPQLYRMLWKLNTKLPNIL